MEEKAGWWLLGDSSQVLASLRWDGQPSWFSIFSTESPTSKEPPSPGKPPTFGHSPCGRVGGGDLPKPRENPNQLEGLT